MSAEMCHLALRFGVQHKTRRHLNNKYIILHCYGSGMDTQPAYMLRDRFTIMFWGPAPTLSSFFTLHDHRVIAKFLHECFAHRSMLLESVLEVPQH